MEQVKRKILQDALKEGVLRLKPTWVPRTFLSPGGKLKLAAQDTYALGVNRGGISERWIASTTYADNGPDTPEDEGLSYICFDGEDDSHSVTLREAVEEFGDSMIGREAFEKYRGWQVLTKIYHYSTPIHHHIHLRDEDAAKVGHKGKPEAYYFPPELNQTEGNFPYTFFGLIPGTKKEDVKACLKKWNDGDNGILNLSPAYKLEAGTGWYVPGGILHAPGTLVTYEIQRASDVLSMFQSLSYGRPTSYDLLVKDVPEDHKQDLDYVIGLLDWQGNIDPDFYQHHFRKPVPSAEEQGYREKWIAYGSEYFCGKELTVFPSQTVRIKENDAFGVLVVNGYGLIGSLKASSPSMIRYGARTEDEFFVTADAARRGITIQNLSGTDNLVLLKNFGPGKTDQPGMN